MALITCPECEHRVSSTATACPNCGAPIAQAKEGRAAGAPLTTVQETSKKLKLQVLVASLAFWIGVVWYFATLNGSKVDGWAVVLIFVGVGMYLSAKLRIWWHHR